MDKPTKILSDEHQNILKVINDLVKECRALESNQEIDVSFFNKTIEFIKNYADKFHHAKEEDILFNELLKNIDKMHCNPIPQMLREHDLGRNLVKELEKGINEKDKNKVIVNAKEYAQLLQEHIFKEDNILYPMADEALDQNTQSLILDKFKQYN